MSNLVNISPTVGLAEYEPNALREVCVRYLKGVSKNLNETQISDFIDIAIACRLNPLKREIYAIGYESGNTFNMSIVTGYEVYLQRAESSGLLDGWETEFTGNEADGTLACIVTIYRKDWTRPFKWTAWYSEAVQTTKDGKPTKFWQKARLMTRKVAISQAFRLAFPEQIGRLPYTADEIGDKSIDADFEVVATKANAKPATNASQKHSNKFDNAFEVFSTMQPTEPTINIPEKRTNTLEIALDEALDNCQTRQDFEQVLREIVSNFPKEHPLWEKARLISTKFPKTQNENNNGNL